MASTAPAADVLAPARAAGERAMYTWAAIAAIAVVFVGFAPTYFLKPLFATPDLTPLKHVHGIVMTSWFVLFLVQARLVATGNTAVHRKLGLAAIALAAAMVVLGVQAAIAAARAGVTPLPKIPPLAFFAVPLGDVVVFGGLFTAAILLRRRSPWHKRLMLTASLAMLAPAFARWPVIGGFGPPAIFGAADLLIVACMLHDRRTNGRIHRAFIVGLAVVVVGQIGRLAISMTPQWMTFARWATS